MDILSHTLTGVAIGSVFANQGNKSWKQKINCFLIGGSGGALPDLDALSLWSGFNSTIGKLFSLRHSGSDIYFGKFWYSHHGAMHSILAAFSILLFFLIIRFVSSHCSLKCIKHSLLRKSFYYWSFLLGFILHLFEDMPTPAAVWGGVRLWFPLDTYVGGLGKIWWWNNYDLFLIICLVILLNSLSCTIPKRVFQYSNKAAISIFFIGVSLFSYSILSRPISFQYTGHTNKYQDFEAQSKKIQKELLGEYIYLKMEKFDNMLPIYF